MFKLKPLSKEAIPDALDKAVRYRLLNDPWQAESICRDILTVDPDNQHAVVTLILSITDQFDSKFRVSLSQALEMLSDLKNEYQRNYYKGLIYERQATAALKRASPRSGYIAYEYLIQAMDWYDKAEKSRPIDNEESILRWNACARMITQHKLRPAQEERDVQPFLDI
ncbi:MAG: hypothetical protein DHS20C18_17010 [Saprospiraceae bacterium]|nr:MAG: hypothetical protein DHS20C18_17010 [Saprospiraceae bacterium]